MNENKRDIIKFDYSSILKKTREFQQKKKNIKVNPDTCEHICFDFTLNKLVRNEKQVFINEKTIYSECLLCHKIIEEQEHNDLLKKGLVIPYGNIEHITSYNNMIKKLELFRTLFSRISKANPDKSNKEILNNFKELITESEVKTSQVIQKIKKY